MAVKLQAAAVELLKRWRAANQGIPGEERTALGWADAIHRYTWKDANGKRQITVWELGLNSYGATRNHLLEAKPLFAIDEFKVLIRAKSTYNASSRPDQSLVDSEGMAPCPGGYNKELFHVLGLLRSCEFAVLAERTNASVAKKRKDYREGRPIEEEECVADDESEQLTE